MTVTYKIVASIVSAAMLLGCHLADDNIKHDSQLPDVQTVTAHDYRADLSGIAGVQEMILSVRNLEEAVTIYTELGNWNVIASGQMDTNAKTQFQISYETPSKYTVLSNPGHKWGFLRLIQFGDGSAPEIRPSARPFDTGGIFNINMFAKDINATFEEMRHDGFVGFAEPSSYTLSMGEYAGAILSGHDGVVVNLLSRLSRGYDDYDPFSNISNILNSTQVVSDFEKSARFYQDKMGFTLKFEFEPKWRENGDNNFSLPNSIAQSGAVKQKAISLMLDKDKLGGTIELLTFDGITGRDFSDRAVAPNRGILMYGIHKNDLADYREQIWDKGVITNPPQELGLSEFELPPYGRVEAFTVKAPGGALMLFFEQSVETK